MLRIPASHAAATIAYGGRFVTSQALVTAVGDSRNAAAGMFLLFFRNLPPVPPEPLYRSVLLPWTLG